jgi:type I restriction enzyme S subunit
MIADLKPYPEYKESGLPWLDAIPSHWTTTRNGNLFQQRNETQRPELPILEVSLRTGVRVREFGSSKRKQVMADASKYKRSDAGDITYNMMRMWQGAVGVAPVEGLVSPAYVVARPFSGTHSSYYVTLFKNGLYMGEIDAASRGIVKDRNRLYWEQFKQMRSLAPPPAEQAAIVRFLDHWNGRLEKAIRSKRRVIALLQEQKQAIIHRAVTRGLAPNVKLKDSGIPWLGEIPEHWEVNRLSFLADFSNGKAHEQFFHPDGEIVCVNARFVSTGGTGIKYCTQNFWPARRGDVLMVMSDLPNGRALARAYLVNDDRNYAVNQRVCRLRPKRVEAGFLAYAANRNYGLLRHDDGSNQTHLSTGDYKTLPLQRPPVDEQQAIVQYLDAHVSQADIRITRYEREIALLREYRTRLTADVVTGKLDVRAAAAQLPATEQEPAAAGELEEESEEEEVEA